MTSYSGQALGNAPTLLCVAADHFFMPPPMLMFNISGADQIEMDTLP
jgi:hypothetical protein